MDSPDSTYRFNMRISVGGLCPHCGAYYIQKVDDELSDEVAEKVIREDGLDYIALSLPLIREPGLPKRWIQGDRNPAR